MCLVPARGLPDMKKPAISGGLSIFQVHLD